MIQYENSMTNLLYKGHHTSLMHISMYGDYSTSVSCEMTRMTYSIDNYRDNKTISIRIRSAAVGMFRIPEIDDNWCSVGVYVPSETDMNFNLHITNIPYLLLLGYLPTMKIYTDAQILDLGEYNGQYGVELDAPKLEELSINIESYKKLILSPNTKPKVIFKTGVERDIYDSTIDDSWLNKSSDPIDMY